MMKLTQISQILLELSIAPIFTLALYQPSYGDQEFGYNASANNSINHGEKILIIGQSNININPQDFQAYFSRGLKRAALGDHQGAIQDYNQAIKINPHNSNAYYNRGNSRLQLGDKPGAIVDFKKAASLYQQQGKQDNYQNMLEIIKKLQQ
jgi:tetratricopeptide (TPR) repeat protein